MGGLKCATGCERASACDPRRVRGVWREGEPSPPHRTAHPRAESHALWGPGGKGFCWESGRAGRQAGRSWGRGGGPRMRRLPSCGRWGCAEKRGVVVGAAVLAAVGEGAAAGFLRTDAIGAPGKVGIQPQMGP